MRRLGARDAALLWTLLGVWAVCFTLHVNALATGRLAWLPLQVAGADGPDDYPVVSGFWSGAEAEASSLRPGDRLVSVGEAPLRGAGPLGFAARAYQALGDTGPAPRLRFERAGERGEAALPLVPVRWPGRVTFLSLVFVAAGAVAFVRSRGMRAAGLLFVSMWGYALHWTYFFGSPPALTPLAVAVFALGVSVALVCACWALLEFPPETARRGAWRWLPLVFAPVGPAASSWAFDWPLSSSLGWSLNLGGSIAFLLVMALLLLSNFRRASGDGRRQIKWVVLGVQVGVVPPLLAGVATLARPELWWLWELSLFSLAAIPLGAAVALAHDRLFDVDGLLTRASSLSLLSLGLVALLIFVIPRLGAALDEVVDPTVAQMGLSVLAAGALFGLRSWLEPTLGRALFAERRRLETESQRLRDSFDRCEKPRELLTRLGEGLRELLAPSCTVVYSPSGTVLAPLYADGPAVAPGFELEGAFARGLERLAGPVSRHELGRLPTWQPSETEVAALDAMGVDLVLPLVLDGRLEALVCLGEKRSGDLYSQTDRALLAGVVDRACQELRHFERERTLETERARSERLERFVPGAVRERIDGGEALDARPRQVTVLFVDIRGYTAFSEQHRPDEIFSLVNRYTAAVSARIRAHGGAVVDFSGDGLMAVFGAPEAHAEKERAAVRAARAIVAEVRELLAEGRGEEPFARDVGVGIASGEGYTGTIRSVERDIWCVLGNTTNLAARLQALSRELEASVVIDEATAQACAGELAGFERVGLRQVRGRNVPVLLYALPLA